MEDFISSAIFISHKLNEVLACSDEITVLRQGGVVGGIPHAEATEALLVSMIIGAKHTVPTPELPDYLNN